MKNTCGKSYRYCAKCRAPAVGIQRRRRRSIAGFGPVVEIGVTGVWESLIELWRCYNLHLARVIGDAAPETLTHACRVGDGEEVPLRFLMEDYLVHMEDHLLELLKPL